jgi:hypothetical protein
LAELEAALKTKTKATTAHQGGGQGGSPAAWVAGKCEQLLLPL